MTDATAPPHWPALDGMRGVAVAGVVVFHLRPEWLPGGFLGVDLFFALSGFLITSLLVRDAATPGGVRVAAFWGRRFRRLLPAVMLLIATVLAWTAIWGTPAEQAIARSDATWAVPYLANWHLIDSARDYWAAATVESPFTHLWSLAIEEQFYVAWPLLVWLLLRGVRGERRLLALTAAAALASAAALALLYESAGATRAYMGTDTRAFALLFGALFALDPVRTRVAALVTARRPVGSIARVALPTSLAAIWWYGGDHLGWLLGGGLIAHSLLAAALVCVLSASRGRLAAALSTRAPVWLGRLSYGIYLWHWPVIQLGRPRLDALPHALQDVVLLTIAVALAVVSFHLVEHPIRRQTGWATGRRAAWATLAAAAVATTAIVAAPTGRGHVAAFDPGSIGDIQPVSAPVTTTTPPASPPDATTPSTPPRPSSLPTPAAPTPVAGSPGPSAAGRTPSNDADLAPPVVVAATSAETGAAARETAPSTASAPPVETIADLPAPPPRAIRRVLWVGDSVAADLAPAVVAALSAAGLDVVDAAFAARRVITSDGVDAETLYPPIVTGARPDVVIVQPSLWDDEYPVETQRAAYEWFWELVTGTGAELVFVTPPPVRVDQAHARLPQHLEVLARFVETHPGTHLLDAVVAWGGEFDADVGDDGAPDRKPDGVHVCPQGAARLAAWLVDELDHIYDGVTPVFPSAWVGGTWATHDNYDTPVGSCAAVDPSAG